MTGPGAPWCSAAVWRRGPDSRRHMLAGVRGPMGCRGSGVERRSHCDIAWRCVGGAWGWRGELGPESVVKGAELDGEGSPGDGETASL